MVTHIAHMDQDQSTDRSGEYLVYGNAADATTFASGMSALGFRSSVQGQVNLGLVASHNPDIIKAYGGMMGGHWSPWSWRRCSPGLGVTVFSVCTVTRGCIMPAEKLFMRCPSQP